MCDISDRKINDDPSSLFPNKMQTRRLNDGLVCHFLLMTGTGNTNWDWISSFHFNIEERKLVMQDSQQ